MAASLAVRDDEIRELMDDPMCDPGVLERTYARFGTVNAVVSGQRAVYRRWIRSRERSGRPLRMLDIGTGGADFPRRALGWARREGRPLEVLAIDSDPRAIAYAGRRDAVPGLHVSQAVSREVRDAGEQFDVVVSNHLLHHLDAPQVTELLDDCEQLVAPGGVVVHGDIERSRGAYAAFAAFTAPFERNLLRGTFIRPDGLTSIRRARTARELAAMIPRGWWVRRAFPWRVEVIWENT